MEDSRRIIQTEKDADLKDMAKEELELLQTEQTELEERIRILLLPKDPEDAKDAILEIRAGTGGDEAALCRRSVQDVPALLRCQRLEDRCHQHE